jgi:hypothetical protein
MTMLSNRMEDYYFVSQGKTRIPGVNDAEEMFATEVSVSYTESDHRIKAQISSTNSTPF